MSTSETRRRFGDCLSTLIVALLVVTSVYVDAQVAYRSGVILVPVDVRVIDRNGQPVTDLTVSDFRLFDDDIRQEIAHFVRLDYSTDFVPVSALSPLRADKRIFIFVLGRGRLNSPGRGLDALIEFVNSSTLPRDEVGVVTYGRALGPMRERGPITLLLERYRSRHERIESLMARDFESHRVGSGGFADDTNAAVDELFDDPGLPELRALSGGAAKSPKLNFEMVQLANAIAFLAGLPGEKHLLFVNEEEPPIGVGRDPDYFARLAATARVTLSVLQTGGMTIADSYRDFHGMLPASRAPLASRLATNLTAYSGGMASLFGEPRAFLQKWERATRSSYLLGFYPKSSRPGRQSGRIRVEVTRPSETPLYRHAYDERAWLSDVVDVREALSKSRVEFAFTVLSRQNATDAVGTSRNLLRVSTALVGPVHNEAAHIRVRARFDPSRAGFERVGARYRATLDLTIKVLGSDGAVVSPYRQQVILDLDARAYARAKRDWLELSVSLTTPDTAQRALVVVYDYDTDRCWMGSAAIRIPSR